MKAKRKLTRESLRLWLLAVTIGSGVLLFSYIAVQQSLRYSLNEPQLQIAQDAANQLSTGDKTPQSIIPTTSVDESRSLAPFVTIVDKNGSVLASSGKIGEVVPLPPLSAFSDAQKRTSTWFTWQHNNNTLRDAAVIVPFNGKTSGYVLVARSMSQTEELISRITVFAAWTLLGILLVPALIIFLI